MIFTTFVEASAGCGKTTFLLNELTKYKSYEILFLAFSNAAVIEIKERLNHLEKFSDTTIHTIHALAYQIVKFKNKDLILMKEKIDEIILIELMKDFDFKNLVSWLLKNEDKLSFENSDKNIDKNFPKPTILQTANYATEKYVLQKLQQENLIEKQELQEIKNIFYTQKNEIRKKIKDYSEEEIEFALNRINMHEQYLNNYINWVKASLQNIFEEKKIEKQKLNNWIDFDQILMAASDIIKNDLSVSYDFFKNIKLILIDESQDLSKKQWDFILTLIKQIDNLHLIIAGDPKQLIYEFQGANLTDYYFYKNEIKKNSELFDEKYLNKTYRLPSNICDYINNLFQNKIHAKFDYQSHVSAKSDLGSITFPKIENYSDILNLIDLDKKNMILFRQETDNIKKLALEFFKKGYFLNSYLFFYHPMIQDFIYLLKWIYYENDFAFYVLNQKCSMENLEKLKFNFKNIFNFNLLDLCLSWCEIVHDFNKEKLGSSLEYWNFVLSSYSSFYGKDIENAILDKNGFYNNNLKIFEVGIFFNTIHSSKGKEGDKVILLDFDAASKFNNDNYNLLYVALTRTRCDLIIPFTKHKHKEKYSNTWFDLLV